MKRITYISSFKNMSITLGTQVPFVLRESEGLRGVEADVKTFRNINQQGCSIRSTNVREREITLRGAIVYDTKAERDLLRKRVYDTFHPRHNGKIEVETASGLIYELENIYVEDAPTFEEDLNQPYIDMFSVNIICPNPFLLSPMKKLSLQTITGNFKFNWEILEKGVALAYIDHRALQNAYNNGAVDVPPTIIIRSRGTIENPFIYNMTTQEAIAINTQLNSGESIEITTDYGNKRITLIDKNGNRENIFHLIDLNSTFFHLAVGDNLVHYGADTNEEHMTVDIYYQERNLGL